MNLPNRFAVFHSIDHLMRFSLFLNTQISSGNSRKENTIFVQKEYDTKHAKAIAKEIGGDVKIINPLSEEWLTTTTEIIHAIHSSLTN